MRAFFKATYIAVGQLGRLALIGRDHAAARQREGTSKVLASCLLVQSREEICGSLRTSGMSLHKSRWICF
jgi:hypothetical protein